MQSVKSKTTQDLLNQGLFNLNVSNHDAARQIFDYIISDKTVNATTKKNIGVIYPEN